jgi:hypothetical protein
MGYSIAFIKPFNLVVSFELVLAVLFTASRTFVQGSQIYKVPPLTSRSAIDTRMAWTAVPNYR